MRTDDYQTTMCTPPDLPYTQAEWRNIVADAHEIWNERIAEWKRLGILPPDCPAEWE